MRALALVTVLSGLALSAPAMAGTVNFADGRGTWQPTKCSPPQVPLATTPGSEAAANDLNARLTAHNQYAAAAQTYMTCVSQEAQTDANGVSQAIVNAAQNAIQQTQSQVSASAAEAQRR